MDPIPKKKPITRKKFEEKVDLYMQGLFGGMGRELLLPLLNKVYQEAKDAGVVTPEEAFSYADERKNYYKNLNMRQQMRAPFAKGTIPEGMKGSKKPELITQGRNKGKYAITRFVDGKYKRVILDKKQADEIGKLTKVILKQNNEPVWPDPKREKMFIEDLKKKLQFPAGKATPKELKAAALAKKYPEISERQIERATKYYRENLNLKYKKGIGADDPTGVKTQKERREALKKKSNLTYENRLTGNEKFHKSHMSDLYTKDVRTGTIGYARASINMEDLDDIDAKMKALYKQQENLLKKNPKNFKILMDEVNRKGTDLAAQSGGYKKFEAIDPITKKSFIINFSSAAQELDPTDILENKKLSELDTKLDKRTVETLKENALKNISKFGSFAKPISKVALRAVSPFVPVLGTAGMVMGGADVAKAAEQGLRNEELGIAYLAGPEVAQNYASLKERVRGQKDETEAFVP